MSYRLHAAYEDGSQGPIGKASGIILWTLGFHWDSKELALPQPETDRGVPSECPCPIFTPTP